MMLEGWGLIVGTFTCRAASPARFPACQPPAASQPTYLHSAATGVPKRAAIYRFTA